MLSDHQDAKIHNAISRDQGAKTNLLAIFCNPDIRGSDTAIESSTYRHFLVVARFGGSRTCTLQKTFVGETL
jgi:hypothetical protein